MREITPSLSTEKHQCLRLCDFLTSFIRFSDGASFLLERNDAFSQSEASNGKPSRRRSVPSAQG